MKFILAFQATCLCYLLVYVTGSLSAQTKASISTTTRTATKTSTTAAPTLKASLIGQLNLGSVYYGLDGTISTIITGSVKMTNSIDCPNSSKFVDHC